jgi:GNAT superfamily N-acetyltransferase
MERARSTAVTIEILADRPDLLVPLAQIRWQEWRTHPAREALPWWVETTRHEAGHDGVPVTFVAADAAGEAVGGVGLIDLPQEMPELAGRGPWVVGTIVRADRRGQGIGSALMAWLTQWATGAGIDRL